MADSADARSFGQLLSDLGSDLARLVKAEAELMILLQALVLALSKVMDPVWASLLVGVGVAIVGAVILRTGAKTAQGANLKPERAQAQFRKDAELIKEQVK